MIKTYYLAFDVGCIECGEDSGVVGLFKTREEAQTASDAAATIQKEDWHGQHHFDVYEIQVDD